MQRLTLSSILLPVAVAVVSLCAGATLGYLVLPLAVSTSEQGVPTHSANPLAPRVVTTQPEPPPPAEEPAPAPTTALVLPPPPPATQPLPTDVFAESPPPAAKADSPPLAADTTTQPLAQKALDAAVAASASKSRHGLTILQLGDNHTASDYFTGQIRRRLQAKFGDGGAGYLVAGKPDPDVRSDMFDVDVSAGWTYASLQRGSDPSLFALSGFNATAAKASEIMTFTAKQPVEFDAIEIEATMRPNGGVVDVMVDDVLFCHCALVAEREMRALVRLTRHADSHGQLHRITLTTTDDKPVTIASLGITHNTGLNYSSVGFPGATVDIVTKLEPSLLADEMQRLRPDFIVLSFGTNEAESDTFDAAKYRSRYLSAIQHLKAAAPDTRIIVVLPPESERIADSCKAKAATAECRPPATAAATTPPDKSCAWRTLPNLASVRDVQQALASEASILTWNWADVTPGPCGAHVWFKATPKLMSGDHLHFTPEGYRRSADRFVDAMLPLLVSYATAHNIPVNN